GRDVVALLDQAHELLVRQPRHVQVVPGVLSGGLVRAHGRPSFLGALSGGSTLPRPSFGLGGTPPRGHSRAASCFLLSCRHLILLRGLSPPESPFVCNTPLKRGGERVPSTAGAGRGHGLTAPSLVRGRTTNAATSAGEDLRHRAPRQW